MHCPFSTLTLMNMKYGFFLPGWAKYWEEDMQIKNVSKHGIWKYLWRLWLSENTVCWKGRCKSIYAHWLLSFSLGCTEAIKRMGFSCLHQYIWSDRRRNYWDMSPTQLCHLSFALGCIQCYKTPFKYCFCTRHILKFSFFYSRKLNMHNLTMSTQLRPPYKTFFFQIRPCESYDINPNHVKDYVFTHVHNAESLKKWFCTGSSYSDIVSYACKIMHSSSQSSLN